MGIYDLELLKQTCEDLKSGELLQKVNAISSSPDLTYKIIMGVVAIGGAVLCSKMFFNLFNTALPVDERYESRRTNSFSVKGIKKDDDDPTNKRRVHKIIGNIPGYMESIKQK